MKTAAVFPGQGSQSVGMGKELYENFNTFKETVEEASDTLNLSFKKLFFEGPEEELMLTKNTQPAIVACSVASFRVLENEFGFKPDFVAGHSVGEYAALTACGALKFSDALKAVRLRGESMQEAVPVGKGAMAALLGPSDEQAVELCKWVEKQNPDWVFEAANFNCPGQVVLSGTKEALDWLTENINSYTFDPAPRKVRLMPLKVSAPFHCKLMLPAQEKMAEFFNNMTFNKPHTNLVQNVTAEKETDPQTLKKNLINQVSGAVLWTKSIQNMKADAFVETGSGTTLSGLIKKIIPEPKLYNTHSLEAVKTFATLF